MPARWIRAATLLACLAALGCTPGIPSLHADPIALDAPREVPFALSAGVPIVEVSINGAGPYRLVFDTGAAMLALDVSVAEALALPRARYDAGTLAQSFGGFTPSYFSHVDSIRVGDLERTGLDAMVSEFTKNSETDLDGLLGLPVFYDLVTTVDYTRRVVHFTRGPRLEAGAPDVLPVERQYGISLYVNASFEGRTFLARLDTGAAAALSAEPRFIEALREPPRLVPYSETRSPTGSAPTAAGRVPGDLVLGRHVFRDPIVIAPQRPVLLGRSRGYLERLEPPLTIGHAFLREFELVIDPRSGLVRLTRPGSEPIASPPLRTVDLRVRTKWRGGALFVIDAGGGTGDDRLRVDDEILSIGGRPVPEYSPRMLGDYAEGDTLEIEVRRGEERVRISAPILTLVP